MLEFFSQAFVTIGAVVLMAAAVWVILVAGQFVRLWLGAGEGEDRGCE